MSMSPVRQPLHIFRKDAIHLWPETLVSILILIGYAYMQSKSWPTAGAIDPAPIASALLAFLIPVSWLVLVSRLVHDEELVGDRQFWTTRPYTWYGLLASKVLYLIAFVLLPFALTQAWMLHHAGLYPTHLISGLLSNLNIVSLAFLLPFLAIAAVTATFPRYISSVVGALLYLIVIVLVVAYKWPSQLTAPFLGETLAVVSVLLLIEALIIQYARRKTMSARLVLLGTPIILALIVIVLPVNTLTGHRYPDKQLAKLGFGADYTPPPANGNLLIVRNDVVLQLPVTIDVPADPNRAFIDVQNSQLTIDGPGGYHYTSDWFPTGTAFTNQPGALISVLLPQDVFNKVHNQPVALHVLFGVQTFTASKPYTISATEAAFPVPDHGACKFNDGALDCTSPFSDPHFSHISAVIHDGECAAPGPHSASVQGTLQRSSPGLVLNPVKVNHIDFGFGRQPVNICPGTPVTFTSATAGDYSRLHLDIPSITLDAYASRVASKPAQPAPTPQ